MEWGWVDLLTRARASRPTEQGSLMARAAILQKPGALALFASLIVQKLPVSQSTPGSLGPVLQITLHQETCVGLVPISRSLTVCCTYDMGR